MTQKTIGCVGDLQSRSMNTRRGISTTTLFFGSAKYPSCLFLHCNWTSEMTLVVSHSFTTRNFLTGQKHQNKSTTHTLFLQQPKYNTRSNSSLLLKSTRSECPNLRVFKIQSQSWLKHLGLVILSIVNSQMIYSP